MKLFALLIVFLSSSLCLAGDLEFLTYPKSPRLFQSDATCNTGTSREINVTNSYFRQQFQLVNNGQSDIELVKVVYHVIDENSSYLKTLDEEVYEVVAAGETYTPWWMVCVGGLPHNETLRFYIEYQTFDRNKSTLTIHETPITEFKN